MNVKILLALAVIFVILYKVTASTNEQRKVNSERRAKRDTKCKDKGMKDYIFRAKVSNSVSIASLGRRSIGSIDSGSIPELCKCLLVTKEIYFANIKQLHDNLENYIMEKILSMQ